MTKPNSNGQVVIPKHKITYRLISLLSLFACIHSMHAIELSMNQDINSRSILEEGNTNIESHRQLNILDNFLKAKNYADEDFLDVDADSDDFIEKARKSDYDEKNMNDNMDMQNGDEASVHHHPWGNYTRCSWYTLSHYISPQSMLYDAIEGFMLALLFCMTVATIYNFCYYHFLTKYGFCPDDRTNKSLLTRRGRRRRRKQLAKGKAPSSCFGCCKRKNHGYDGRGNFMPLSQSNDFSDDDDSSDSSVSLDSALSLEYGDGHLQNEFGEVTSRWDDDKIEAAARKYFTREEKQSEAKIKKKVTISFQKGKKKPGDRKRIRKNGSKKSRDSSAKSQASSILSSDSDVSYNSDGSSDYSDLEMEEAMLDLELVKRNIAEKGYV
ncbi:predicted protein [Chaetoceros tenuissimus]|uniref:Uncharacterized protein n=1 Tax=Chaetoceros tenuissimus TaxID=426638 RepID=A0AAD3HEQ8_9STRA|nr:predicted protein [Chaetoceros tenuissimus]